jgi:hypothetical protein
VLYIHGTGRLLNVLNNSLKEVTPPTLLINLSLYFVISVKTETRGIECIQYTTPRPISIK